MYSQLCGELATLLCGGCRKFLCTLRIVIVHFVVINQHASLHFCGYMRVSLIPRPSHCPVFDRLQYAKTEGEGMIHFII